MRGLQPLGPFEEELAERKGLGNTFVHAGAGSPTADIEDPGKDIIVTKGFSTWSESRRPPVSPIEDDVGSKG